MINEIDNRDAYRHLRKFVAFLYSDGALFLFLLVLTGSLTLNVLLALHLRQGAFSKHVHGLSAGASFNEGLQVTDLSGVRRTLMFNSGGRPTILYVFSPFCRFCEENESNLHAMLLKTRARATLLRVSLTDVTLREYVTKHQIADPVYVASPDSINKYRLSFTPQTVLVGASGSVQKVWSGVFSPTIESEMEASLPATLAASQ